MLSKLQESALKLYVNAETLIRDERGQDLIEYALLAGLIAVACVTGMGKVASGINSLFNNISSQVA